MSRKFDASSAPWQACGFRGGRVRAGRRRCRRGSKEAEARCLGGIEINARADCSPLGCPLLRLGLRYRLQPMGFVREPVCRPKLENAYYGVEVLH